MATPVSALILAGVPQRKARLKNDGTLGAEFMPILGATNPTSLTLGAETKSLSAATLIGSTINIRTRPWIIETNTITAFDPTTALATIAGGTQFLATAGSGYILEGKDWMVDQAGEWAQNPGTGQVTAWLPDGMIPSNSPIEFSALPYGVQVTGRGNLLIEHLQIENAAQIGLSIRSVPNYQIRDLKIINSGEVGIQVQDVWGPLINSSTNGQINTTTVVGSGSMGIYLATGNGAAVTGNTIKDTGLGNRAAGSTSAINVRSAAALIQRNSIINSAAPALTVDNEGGVQIMDNNIESACVRVSDCGGIYVSGQTSSTVRSVIARNSVRTMRGNSDGSGGGSPNLVAGIYLDEYSNQFDVVGNMISDVGTGIYLHKAKNNIITGNRVWMAFQSGIRGKSETDITDPLRGNLVAGNTIFMSRNFEPAIGAAVPLRLTPFAQEWIHPTAASAIFVGDNPNIVRDNITVLFGSPAGAQWAIRSGSKSTTIGVDTWRTIATGEEIRTPLDARMAQVTGSMLNLNGEMNAPDTIWKSKFSITDTGGYAKMGVGGYCQNSCLEFMPGNDADIVYQSGMVNSGWTETSLYYLSYSAAAGVAGSQIKTEVHKDVKPFDFAGYNESKTDLVANIFLKQEAFFRPSDASNLQIRFKATPRANIYIDDVKVMRVTTVKLFNPVLYSAHLVNTSLSARTYNCTDTQLASCQVVNDLGQYLTWPLSVPAGTSVIVYAKDDVWTTASPAY
jgi:parallel beta-helix repeat protein